MHRVFLTLIVPLKVHSALCSLSMDRSESSSRAAKACTEPAAKVQGALVDTKKGGGAEATRLSRLSLDIRTTG